LLAATLGAAFWVLAAAARTLPLGGDEPNYVGRGRYFDHLFVQHELGGPVWADGHDTHTQPMLANYVVGGWLRLRGHDLDRLSNALRAKRALLASISGRTVSEGSTLQHAREPMVGIGALTIGIVYLIGRVLGGPGAGIVGAAIATASPLSRSVLPLAGSDALLALFLLLGLLLSTIAIRRSPGGVLPLRYGLGIGIALGLGLGTKLTAAANLALVAVWVPLAALAAARGARTSDGVGRLMRAWRASRGWLLAVGIAFAVFVLSDPHLYPDPIRHTLHLALFRGAALRGQQLGEPEAVQGLLQRPRLVLIGSFVAGTPLGSRGVPLEAGLAAIGALGLAATTRRAWQRTGRLPAEALPLLAALLLLAGESTLLLVAYPRYWLPSTLLTAIFAGLGAATIAELAPGIGRAVIRSGRSNVRGTSGRTAL
jgi:asparagine N-glycosylation enzyme membrane subunit Stt3